jgi:hypothetical protein
MKVHSAYYTRILSCIILIVYFHTLYVHLLVLAATKMFSIFVCLVVTKEVKFY